MNPVNLYINWALQAVYGMMGQADALYRSAGDAIAAVADELQRRFPVARTPIYRGVLLDDVSTFKPDPKLTFLSWSEDPDVARWFASPTSYISEPLASARPTVRGYVLQMQAPPPRVLFHHSWRDVFGPPLEALALQHPQMGREGHRQIAWSLDTQREVITEPLASFPSPEPVDTLPGATVAELDDRFIPPWAFRGGL